MSNVTDVYYVPVFGRKVDQTESVVDIDAIEPENLITHIVENRSKTVEYVKCPAFIDYVKNTFVIKSPIDVSFSVKDSVVQIYDKDEAWVNKFLFSRCNENNKVPMISLEFAGFIFYSKTRVIVEELSPFLSLNVNDALKQIQIIPGTFDISKWIRPTTFTFEVLTDSVLNIKRGDPIYYVKLKTPDDSPVKLIRGEWNSELKAVTAACLGVKERIKGNNLSENYLIGKPIVDWFKSKIK